MTKEAIREYVEAMPFRPFTVRLTDGRPCDVPSRDFAHLAPNGRTLVVFRAGSDGVRVLDVALVTEIQSPPVQTGVSFPKFAMAPTPFRLYLLGAETCRDLTRRFLLNSFG